MGWMLPAAMVASSVLPSLLNKKTGSQTVKQGPMETPEQKEAREMALNFAKTGKHGNYRAGESYKGDLGNYELSDMERVGQSSLSGLMNKAIGTQNFGEGMGKEQLTELMQGDKFDPYNEKGTYGGFKRKTLRELQEGGDRLKRGMAVTGDLYSTATGKEMGLLHERGQDQLSSKLAELYQDYSNKKIGAIPWALQNDQFGDEMEFREKAQNENIAMNRIGASQKYGATQRILDDQKAKDLYGEWKRSHEDSKEPLRALEGIYGNSTNWGAKSMTAPGYSSPSPFAGILDNGLQLWGKYLDSKKTPTGAFQTGAYQTGDFPTGSARNLA